MMKLSTMMEVFETVDSEWRSPLAEKIAKKWGHDENSVFCVRASANFVFIFRKEGIPYYLRFNHSSERELQVIEAEVEIVQYLGNASLKVAQPVKSLNEKYVEAVETELGTFYAVVFEALEGKHYEIDEITKEQIFLWGQSLGKLHETLKKMPEQYHMNRPSWRDRLTIAKEIIPSSEQDAHKEWQKILTWAEELRITKENFGIIHYDFELDNIVFKDRLISILDFDDCSINWYVADIVYALRDVGKFDLHSPTIKEFIEGYKNETNLDEDILKQASQFERMHELLSFATLIRTVDIEDSPEYPEWLLSLRKKLCKVMDEYRLSFKEANKTSGAN